MEAAALPRRRAAGGARRGRALRHRIVARLGRQGQRLLGIRAVLALSFERIHRSNLIGMGILPLRLPPQWGRRLQLAPGDRIDIDAPASALRRAPVPVRVLRADGGQLAFEAIAAVETQLEPRCWPQAA